jgi:putative transposase
VRRAYKFRMRPTAGQHLRLAACVQSHRELYNAALQERRDAWRMCRKAVSYGVQSGQLKCIRRDRLDVAVWSFSSQQATLRRLNRSYEGFFRRVKAGRNAGYPRFKSRDRFDTVEWPKDGDGCRWKPDVSRIYLRGVGEVKVTAHREVQGRVKTIQIRRAGRKWYLLLSCDEVPTRPLAPTGRVGGIDLGIADYAVTSDGQHLDNPHWGRSGARRLTAAQQALARKQPKSNNRGVAKETVAARHRKIANRRRDWHHKTACGLVAGYDVVVMENLKIKNMVRRAKPRPDPEVPGGFLANGQVAKSKLNRSIQDAGWAGFVNILKAKAEEAGRRVVDVDPRHTSDRCEACQHAAEENRVSQTLFACQNCGHTAQADEQAARNILRAGLALLAAEQAEAA